jgi:hypothetical protein
MANPSYNFLDPYLPEAPAATAPASRAAAPALTCATEAPAATAPAPPAAPASRAAAPAALTCATNEQINSEIQRLINGAYNHLPGRKKFPKNLKPLAQMILDKGQTTADEYRRSGQNRQHAWQRKLDLTEYIPIDDKGRTSNNEAIYRFDYDAIRAQGSILKEPNLRDTLTRKERRAIYVAHGDRCSFCGRPGAAHHKFQIDHAIPFKVPGGQARWLVADASCNRTKAHQCKNCPNYEKDPVICYSETSRCFWACTVNEAYTHVETRPERLIRLPVLSNEDIAIVDAAQARGVNVPEALLKSLREVLGAKDG